MAEYDESDYDSDSGSYSDYVHEEQAIFRAVRAFDVEALRRCLAAGADPDMFEDDNRHSTLLYDAVYYCSARRDMDFLIQERLGCISVLLKAGASVDKLVMEATALHWSAGVESEAYQLVIAALLEAGADPNFTDTRFSTQWQRSVLAKAAASGTAGAVRMLIAAGAESRLRLEYKGVTIEFRSVGAGACGCSCELRTHQRRWTIAHDNHGGVSS